MRKLILLAVTSAVLAGCAARLPTCDGTVAPLMRLHRPAPSIQAAAPPHRSVS